MLIYCPLPPSPTTTLESRKRCKKLYTFIRRKNIRMDTYENSRFAATATNFTVPIRYPTIISRMATAPRAVLIPVRISPRKDRQRSALRKTAGQNGAMFRVQSSTTIFDEAKPGCLPNKDR